MSDEFNSLAVERLVNELFGGNHFSICDFDKIASLMRLNVNKKIREQLSAYHCVNYSKMSDREKELIQIKTVEALRGDNILNPARVFNQITDEGGDFTFTEDRYIDGNSNILRIDKK